MTLLLKIVLSAAFVYALLLALMYVMQDRLLFMPDRNVYTPAQLRVTAFAPIHATTEDGLNLTGWYAAPQGNKPVAVMFHGNASTYAFRAPDFLTLVSQGYGVLLVGYRGYGGNPGAPSEQGFYKDAEAYLKALALPDARIVFYGESMGTGVAVEMAVRHPKAAGLILEAPYASMPEIAAYHFPFVVGTQYIVKSKFDSIGKILRAPMPKLILLAKNDAVVPSRFGQKLYDAAPEPKTLHLYPDASHNNIRQTGGMLDILSFMATLN